jgi:predicted HTH transcriptional regulator
MDHETISWLNQFASYMLNDHQRVGLAFLRHNEKLTNADYRRLNRVDAAVATRELRGLVQSGLCAIHGSGRWTTYQLAASSSPELTVEQRIIAFIQTHGGITNQAVQEILSVTARQARTILASLRSQGVLVLEGERRTSVYRLASPDDQA